MKKCLAFVALFFLCFYSFSQPFGAGTPNWMPDGNSFTSVERYSIVKTELPSLMKTTLFDLEQFIPKDDAHLRSISSFSFSNDLKQVLLKINTKTKYHKTMGEVWVYNSIGKKIVQLGKELNPDFLMYPKFSPDGSKVAYVYQDNSNHSVVYNLYCEDLKTGKISQLTFDVKDRSINGTFDWVYSEELFCTDGFRWSTDGKQIAYWNVDASKVRNYLMLNTTDSIYPYTVSVEYP